ncbi:hypothetical protein GUJ93_ZPchr0005g14826 [Zizania palustris]|uniref:Protein kinase domain-containing protein n=1 Tax=Zizania palustris TaxID=103762 RepID=A0A8J5S3N8_ZIZPA|nr:hypothetical protein GUJ93_ZPchr0005g14826 [Zizania palustris]
MSRRLGDIVNGSSSLAFISNLTSLSKLDLSFNNITGQIPQSLLNLGNLQFLFLGNNSFTGRLPDVISSSLQTIDFSYNQLIGSLPSWVTQNNLKLFTPTVRNGVPKRRSKAGAIAGILIGALVLGLVVIFGIFLLVKKRRTTAQQKELYNLVGRPDVFSYAELKLATNNFSSQNILGEGGYGPVYKGKLPDGRVIAVKQLSQSSHQGKSEFVTEVETISVVQHRNNSLSLDWAMRFEIILGIARGLTYLHEESSVRIVHRDIKASNVLLDTDLTPKISDFGLAKLYDESQTHGYVAPEYAMRGRLTEKADIFAFGVVMLEIVAGRPNTDNSLEEGKIYLFEWLWSLYEKAQALGIVDPNLNEFNKVEAFRVICVALLCTQGSPHQRPPMSKVVAMLTGEAEVAQVVMKPSYINEWLLRGGIFGNQSYSGFTSSDFSTNIESKHLTQSATITGAGHG